MEKRIFTGLLMAIYFTANCFAQDTATENNYYEKRLRFEQMVGYTFGDKNSWMNISPEIFLGFDTIVNASRNNKNTLRFRFGPTISTSNPEIDSANKLKVLMLPGPVRLSLNIYSKHLVNKKLNLLALTGFEMKMIGRSDSKNNIIQSNFKLGAGIQFQELFGLSAEYSWALHNLTNESQQAFIEAFGCSNTLVNYFTLNVEGYSQAMDMYLVFCWRKFIDAKHFSDSSYMNDKVLSIGVRKDISLFNHTQR